MKSRKFFINVVLAIVSLISLSPTNGQENADSSSIFKTIVVYREPPFSEYILELIELYQEYEKMCWNDSTLIISGGSSTNYSVPTLIDSLGRKVIDLTEIVTMNADYVIKREWIHKEPSFSDFVSWLKEKTK